LNTLARSLLAVVLTVATLPALAAGAEDRIRDSLRKLMPDVEPSSIEQAPVAGIYEVVVGSRVVYMSADGRHVFTGDLLDLEQEKNLTEARRSGQRQRVIDGLDEAGMITYPAAEPRHTVTVFTDIDCPYCRKLHEQMDAYNRRGITVRYLAFPRAGIGSESFRKAVSVWCADDPAAAMDRAKAEKEMPRRSCDNPVAAHLRLAGQLGINGTPTIIADDGRMFPGYVPPARLAAMLAK
jgi:thiol:disulfide interchange protein DsbC